jgi:hypothetical protein
VRDGKDGWHEVVSIPQKVLSRAAAPFNMNPMSKRVCSLFLMIVGIGLAAARTPSQLWMERTGCFLVAFSVIAFLADLRERRGKKQP